MADERSTPATTPAPGPGNSMPATTPAPGPGTATPEATVPSSRLREETARRRRLETELVKLRTQVEALSQPPKTETALPAGRRFQDDYRERLFKELGGDDQAFNAVRMMDEHAAHVNQERGSMTAAQVAQLVDQRLSQSEQKQGAVYGAHAKVNSWIEKGIVSPEAGKAIWGKMTDAIRENPQWAQHAPNVDALLALEFTRAVEAGEVRPYATPPTSPLQPSSRNGGNRSCGY